MKDGETSDRLAPSLETRVANVLGLIARYGACDGEHHKTWLIDQVLRDLTGDDYDAFVGRNFYNTGWDRGLPP